MFGVLLAGLTIAAGLGLVSRAGARPAPIAGPPRAAAAASPFLTGIGDEQTEMFGDVHWRRLHTKIVRYIAPYDAVAHPYSLQQAAAWIAAAEAQHQQILIAFYHSAYTPAKMPSVTTYRRDVERFMKLFPRVRQYEPWNESNRGYVSGLFASPTAVQAAQYYQAVKRACHGCTVVGLDILDQQYIAPTLTYISQFKHEIGVLRTVVPTIWGLHNYSDTNRASSLRTRAVLAAVRGEVWLTETGGIVKFGGAFPNVRGSGLRRAAGALTYMFRLAGSNSRIKRLYVYDWTGGTASTRFDAGLTDTRHVPRAGYLVVCRKLHATGCGNVRISSH